jgi:hypothetical protein
MEICYEQPQIIPPLRAEPVRPRSTVTTHSIPRHVSQWVATGQDFAKTVSARASSIHTLSKPRRSHARNRPSIGLPTSFRHNDGIDGIQSMVEGATEPIRRRRSFSPLELSIYSPSGRLSPLPDFEADDWNILQKPPQALVRDRESIASTSSFNIPRKPIGSSRPSSQISFSSRPTSLTLTALPRMGEEPTSRAESPRSIPGGLQRASTQSSVSSASRILSRLPSPSRSRSNTAPSRPTSVRRLKMDVDEAIRELNTIVEERRADAYRSRSQSPALINRPPPSPSHHVPAIAPSLRMRVRSETLSDIGSAFSAPLNAKPLPATPKPSPLSQSTTRLSPPTIRPVPGPGPLNSNPITPPTPTVPTPTTPMHRLGAWIKRSLPTTPTTAATTYKSAPQTPRSTISTPFYQCEPYILTQSQHSRSSSSGSAGSRTITHNRQDSAETATVTLFSTRTHDSIPSTPSLSSRSASPTESQPRTGPQTPATGIATFKASPERKLRRVPAPLVLKKEIDVEPALASSRSTASARSLRPPPSPNYGILKGMEMMGPRVASDRVSAVGIAF